MVVDGRDHHLPRYVPFVRTADNLADMFTKAMKNANDFHRLRRIVMNEQ